MYMCFQGQMGSYIVTATPEQLANNVATIANMAFSDRWVYYVCDFVICWWQKYIYWFYFIYFICRTTSMSRPDAMTRFVKHGDIRSASTLTGGDGIYGNLNADEIMKERREKEQFMNAVGRPPADDQMVKDDHPVYVTFRLIWTVIILFYFIFSSQPHESTLTKRKHTHNI